MKKNFASFFLGFCALIAAPAFAHTPKPGQIAQQQARRLSASRQAFRLAGSVTSNGKTYTTELKWYAPASYDFIVSGLPSSFTGVAGNEGQWVLKRRPGNRCTLVAGTRHAQCSPSQFWAMIELSAQPESVAASLVRAGIYGSQDTSYEETNSNSVADPSKRRVKLAIGHNGETPKAVMRIRAPGAPSEGNAENDAVPYIDFDQNFLVPLYAQFSFQGALFKIKAYTDLGIDKEQPRSSHVLSSSLTVLKGNDAIARFSRKEVVADRSLKEEKAQDGAIALSSFQESLGGDANDLLTAILLTH